MRLLIICFSILTKLSLGQINVLTDCLNSQTDQVKCLNFGQIGFDTDDLTFKRISKRVERITDTHDTLSLAYILPTDKRKITKEFKLFKTSFLGVTKVNDVVQSLELYGCVKVDNLDFYGINLGSKVEDLIRRFGQPEKIKPFDHLKGEIWEYPDKRYSFVVKSDIVVIIKLNRAG